MSDYLDYADVRQELLDQRTSGTLTTEELALVDRRLLRAYQTVLRDQPWSFLRQSMTVACDNGKVLASALGYPLHVKFYSADPRPANADSVQIIPEPSGSGAEAAYYLPTTLTTVFAFYWPNQETLGDWANDANLYAAPNDYTLDPNYKGLITAESLATSISVGDIYKWEGSFRECAVAGTLADIGNIGEVFTNWTDLSRFISGRIYLVDGNYYRCLASTPDRPPGNAFQLLGPRYPIHRLLAKPTVWLALAEWYAKPQELATRQQFLSDADYELTRVFSLTQQK